MSGSFIFYFHLLGFGLITTAVVAGWFLNLRFTAAQDTDIRISVGSMMRTIAILSPLAAFLLLATGIGNILNLYYETPVVWYQQGWLVIKIVLFGVMLVNGTVFGPLMSRKRMHIVRNLAENTGTEEDEKNLKYLNKQMNWFFTVQSVLLLGIVFFSAFGTSKHPGYF
ncbi:MAG TPA: hypothetical protein VJN65_07095 [Bacteroidota bacterium]|nr:hypothetical protein [Bacteroidota bacterium]